MQNENLRDIARRLIENYRLKRSGSPCRLADVRLTDAIAQGYEAAKQVTAAAPEKIAEQLSDDRAFLFDITLTESDVQFLELMRIDPQ